MSVASTVVFVQDNLGAPAVGAGLGGGIGAAASYLAQQSVNPIWVGVGAAAGGVTAIAVQVWKNDEITSCRQQKLTAAVAAKSAV
jgi:hypothetical protein